MLKFLSFNSKCLFIPFSFRHSPFWDPAGAPDSWFYVHVEWGWMWLPFLFISFHLFMFCFCMRGSRSSYNQWLHQPLVAMEPDLCVRKWRPTINQWVAAILNDEAVGKLAEQKLHGWKFQCADKWLTLNTTSRIASFVHLVHVFAFAFEGAHLRYIHWIHFVRFLFAYIFFFYLGSIFCNSLFLLRVFYVLLQENENQFSKMVYRWEVLPGNPILSNPLLWSLLETKQRNRLLWQDW